MSVPALFLVPRGHFVRDDGLADLAQRVLRCGKRNRPDPFVVAMAKSSSNDSFLVSSVTQDVLDAVCASFLRDRAPGGARIVVLAFPHNAFVIGCDDAIDDTPRRAPGLAQPSFAPFRWSSACNDLMTSRVKEMASVFIHCELMADMVHDAAEQIATLKQSLADELIAREDQTASEMHKERRMRQKTDERTRLLAAERTRANELQRALDRERATNERLTRASEELARSLDDERRRTGELSRRCQREARTAAVLHDAVRRLRAHVTESAEELRALKASLECQRKARTSALDAETSSLIQLLQVAFQCNHYFSVDRFSSLHFRQQIERAADGSEAILLCSLAEFPRMRSLCDGSHLVIAAACNLLQLRVCDGRVHLPPTSVVE